MKKLEVPSKEDLYKLYIGEEMSLAKIASIYSVSAMTVRSWLIGRGLSTKTSTQSLYHEIRGVDFSDLQKQLIVGSILGDGGLRIPKRGKNACFYERHCAKQKQYLEWKRDLLLPFVQKDLAMESGGCHTISGVPCITQDSYKMITIAHPYLTELWKKFYIGNGNKVLPMDIEQYINPLVIAVWICDDGCLSFRSRSYRLDFHTENFSYDEVKRLADILSMYFNGNINIYSRKYLTGTKYYITCSGHSALYKFCNELVNLVPDVMKYKFEINI